MLIEFVPKQIWYAQYPVTFVGLVVKTRMTVVRLTDGTLWVHSPIKLDPDVIKDLNELGEVGYVCAPNRFHYLFVDDFMTRFPNASLFVAPGLAEKHPGFKSARRLSDQPEPEWQHDLDQLLFEGIPRLNEVVWLHRASKTLILTDLCQYFREDTTTLIRFVTQLLGVYRKFGMPRTIRLMVRNKAKARASRDRILEWDFQRVIVAHEHIVSANGKNAFSEVLAWLGKEAGLPEP